LDVAFGGGQSGAVGTFHQPITTKNPERVPRISPPFFNFSLNYKAVSQINAVTSTSSLDLVYLDGI
jgi:hypothetical protein